MIKSAIRKTGKYLSKRVFSAILLASAVTAVFILSVTEQFKTVTIEADGKSVTVVTSAKSADTLLSENGVALYPGDEVTPVILNDGATVSVKRAFPLKIHLGTDSFTVNTTAMPLCDVFESEGIVIGKSDIVTPPLETVVSPDTEVTVIRVQIKEECVSAEVPFSRKFVADSSLKRNETQIVTPGESGFCESVYRVTFSNGVETNRELVSEKTIRQPVTEIIKYGAEEINPLREKATAETVSVLASCEYIDCKAYSYIIHGKTATGMKTKRGLIAVDPKVIPLGTKVYVQSLDGKADYGYAIAADTGGMIKGQTIDMWVPTYAEAAQNGVRKMRVYILP